MAEKRDFNNQEDAGKRGFEEEIVDLDDNFEDDEFDREFDDDDFEGEDKPHPLVTAGVFLGLVVLAAIICAILWSFTHRDSGDEQPVNATENAEDATEVIEDTSEAAEDATGEEETQSAEIEEIVENKVSDNEVMGDEAAESVDVENEAEASQATENQIVADGTVESTQPSEESDNESAGGEPVQDPISGNESMTFTEVADTVTAKDVTNLRSAPSTLDSENVVGQLLNGETLARTGVNDATGWSRLDYNGQTVYAVSGYLTTDLNYKTPVAPSDPNRISTQDGRVIIFQNCDDYVTPKEYVNLRIEPSTSQGESTAKYQISNGTAVHRTGYSPDSGWSRVEYNGEVLYVVSSMVMNTYETEQ